MNRKVLIHDIDQHYPSVRQRTTSCLTICAPKTKRTWIWNSVAFITPSDFSTFSNNLTFCPRKTSLIKTTPKIPSMTVTTSLVFNKSILTILMGILINNVVIEKVMVFEICPLFYHQPKAASILEQNAQNYGQNLNWSLVYWSIQFRL